MTTERSCGHPNHGAADHVCRTFLPAAGNRQRAAELLPDGISLDYPDVIDEVAAALDAAEARGRAEALREAAHAWQWGEWANVPRHRDQVADRLGQAQYVTDWLRARVNAECTCDHEDSE